MSQMCCDHGDTNDNICNCTTSASADLSGGDVILIMIIIIIIFILLVGCVTCACCGFCCRIKRKDKLDDYQMVDNLTHYQSIPVHESEDVIQLRPIYEQYHER